MPTRLTTQQQVLRSITEADWQRQVEQIARLGGWLTYHAPDNMPRRSRTGRQYVQAVRAGFPDLVCVKGQRMLFAELKRETGSTTPEQDQWLKALQDTGAEVYVWRPSHRSEVEHVLLDDRLAPARADVQP